MQKNACKSAVSNSKERAGEMMQQNLGYDSAVISSKNYIPAKYLPRPATVKHEILSTSTRPQSYDGVFFLCVCSGKGKVHVNREEHLLQAGSCILLHFFQYFRIEPAKGIELDTYQVFLTGETYHFVMTLPGENLSVLDRTSLSPYTVLPQEECQKVLSLLRFMLESPSPQLQCVYLYELLGRFARCCCTDLGLQKQHR